MRAICLVKIINGSLKILWYALIVIWLLRKTKDVIALIVRFVKLSFVGCVDNLLLAMVRNLKLQVRSIIAIYGVKKKELMLKMLG